MIQVFTLEDILGWDAIVRSFSNYDVYWLSGYVRAFQLHGDGEPMLFYYEDAGVRGINVVMKRDVAKDPHFAGKLPEGQYFDFSTPYGYGGWLIEGEGETAGLFSAYEKWCVKHRIISEFVRFHPVIGNHEAVSSYYNVVPLGEVVTIDLASPEKIWGNFSSTCRNRVRKAIRSDVQVYHGRYPEIFQIFRDIYDQTMKWDNAEDYYFFGPAFYDSVLKDLPEHAQVFYAQVPDGTIAAAAIMLMANGRMNYHLGGMLREYGVVAPMNLLFYKASLWGCANGCRTLYLGGGLGASDGSLLRFKKTLNSKDDTARFYIGKLIFRREIYQQLMVMREEDDPMIGSATFFPAYRAGGHASR